MTNRKLIIAALAAAAIAGGGGAMTLPSQPAEAQAASPAQPAPERPQEPARQRASHIEGRIAYLKTELKITAAQEAQWDKVAQAMRQNSTERRQGFEQVRSERRTPPNALQHLEGEARFAALRAQQADRFLAAFRPLYDTMSDAQKKAADDLMAPRHEHHFRHRA